MNPITYQPVNRVGWRNTWEVSRIVPGTGKVVFGYVCTNTGRGVFWVPEHFNDDIGNMVPASFIISLAEKLKALQRFCEEEGHPDDAGFIFQPGE